MRNPNQDGCGEALLHQPFTYGGDDCACKEETAAEIPVAGVGGVAFGVHALHPGFQDDLWGERKKDLMASAVG